jgi:hypothetical protein
MTSSGHSQNARFTSGFNESGMRIDRRPLAFQNFEACLGRLPVTRTTAGPADIEQGLGCASRAGDRSDYSEFDLDCLCKSFVWHFHLPLLGQLNISADPKFRGAGDYLGLDTTGVTLQEWRAAKRRQAA